VNVIGVPDDTEIEEQFEFSFAAGPTRRTSRSRSAATIPSLAKIRAPPIAGAASMSRPVGLAA
jgi:hypothetical protein